MRNNRTSYTWHAGTMTVTGFVLAAVMFLLPVSLSSCDGSHRPVYSRFVSIDPDGWYNGEYCVFRMAEADSGALTGAFDVILTVRHDTSYPYNNLWIVAEKTEAADSVSAAKVNLRLASTSGSWRGSGMQGIYEFSDTVLRHIPLKHSDVISVRHDMPVSSLPGLIDLGVTIVPSK